MKARLLSLSVAVTLLSASCASFLISPGSLARSLPANGSVAEAGVGVIYDEKPENLGYFANGYYGISLGEHWEIGFAPQFLYDIGEYTIFNSVNSVHGVVGSLMLAAKWDPVPHGEVFHIIPFVGGAAFMLNVGEGFQFIPLPGAGLDLLLDFGGFEAYLGAAMPTNPNFTTIAAGGRADLGAGIQLSFEAGWGMPISPYVNAKIGTTF